MPQQGFGPLIKSREVHLENLRLVRGVGFLLVIPFVIEPDSYENTTSEPVVRWIRGRDSL